MSYLKEYERYIIETMLKDGRSVKDISLRLNRCLSTIYNEIKRGTIELLNSDFTTYSCYCADVAQRKYDSSKHNKGISLKIGSDFKTADFIEQLIKSDKFSPYAVSCELRKKSGLTTLCASTIYSYIHKNIFLNISNSDLHYNTSSKKNAGHVRRPSLNKLGAKLIDERPSAVLDRCEFGHWELDTVYSGKNTSSNCLLVFTERMTRMELIYRIKDRTSQSVLNKINEIENRLGFSGFTSTFKSITCDNGVEFSRFSDIEHSCTVLGRRTSLYFCHPFSSSERGSNENANKLIRKFIPKGSDIGLYSDSDIQHIQDFINNYPRKLFGGLSSHEYCLSLGLF